MEKAALCLLKPWIMLLHVTGCWVALFLLPGIHELDLKAKNREVKPPTFKRVPIIGKLRDRSLAIPNLQCAGPPSSSVQKKMGWALHTQKGELCGTQSISVRWTVLRQWVGELYQAEESCFRVKWGGLQKNLSWKLRGACKKGKCHSLLNLGKGLLVYSCPYISRRKGNCSEILGQIGGEEGIAFIPAIAHGKEGSMNFS